MSSAVISEMLVRIAADTAQLRAEMNQMKQVTGGAFGQVSEGATRLRSQMLGLFAGVVTVGAMKAFVDIADSMKLLEARLKLTVSGSKELADAQADIYRISQLNGADIRATTGLWTKMNEPVKRLGGTTRETTAIVEAFSTSLRLGGANTNEAAAATLQFAQAMGSGKLQGDEFRSMAEASPRFMKALAEGMGVPIEQLKAMGSEGKLTADVVGNALMKSLEQLRAEAESFPDTAGAGFQRVTNEVYRGVEAIDKWAGISSFAADTMGAAGAVVSEFVRILRDLRGETASADEQFESTNLKIRVMGTIFETLVVVGANVGYTMRTIGLELYGIAKQAEAFFSGDFSKASAIGASMREDAAKNRAEIDAFSARVVGMTDRIIESRNAIKGHSISAAENGTEMAKLGRQAGTATGGFKQLKSAIQDSSKAQADAAKVAEKVREEYRKLVVAGADYYVALLRENKAIEASIDLGRELTEAEKGQAKLDAELLEGKVKMTAELEKLTRAEINRNAELKVEERWLRDTKRANDDRLDSLRKATQDMAEQNREQRRSNEAIGLSARALAEREQAMLKDMAVAKERAAVEADLVDWTGATSAELRAQAALLRERAVLAKDGAMREGLKATAEEAKRTSEVIENSLTDSIFRGLEAGRDFFSVFWSGIKNTLKTEVLKPAIQFTVKAGMGAVGSMLGFPSAAGASGGGASGAGGFMDAMSSMSSMSGIAGTLGSLGAAFGGGASYGLAGLMAGNISGTLGGIGAMFGSGSIGMGLGAVAGIAGPVALGLMAIKALETKKTPHLGGYAAINSDGALNAAFGMGESNRSSNLDSSVIGLARSINETLNSTARAFNQDANFATTGVFKSDGKDGSWGVLQLLRGITQVGGFRAEGTLAADSEAGFTEFSNQAAQSVRDALTAMDLPQWASDALKAIGESPGLDKLIETANAIAATNAELDNMADVLRPIGGIFERVASLSSDARMELAGFAGGIEALITQTRGYVDSYYSEDEKMAISAREILRELSAAGIDGSGATKKGDLRSAIEGINPNTTEGRKQLAALLGVAGDYASVGTYLETSGKNLGELAAQSPTVAALEVLANPTVATAEATARTADGVETVASEAPKQTEALDGIEKHAAAQVAATSDGLSTVIDELRRQSDILARIAGAMSAELNAGLAGQGG